MKILIISNEYPPIGGGGSTAVKYTAEYLAEWGHDVTVVTSSYKTLPRIDASGKVTIVRVPAIRRYKDYSAPWELVTFGVSALWQSMRISKKMKPDVVHAFFALPAGWVALLLRVLYGIPYVVTFEGSDMPGSNPARFRALYPFLTPLIRTIWRKAGVATVCSSGLLALGKKHDPLFNFRLIPNGVDLTRFFPTERDQQQPVRIIFVGRIIPRKGLQDVIRALPAVRSSTSIPFILEVVGTGSYLHHLQLLAKELGVDGIIAYTGEVSHDCIHQAFQRADIFILPSASEGMPLGTLEAMGCGLPVITTDVPGNREIVENGKNGFLVPVGDVAQLTGRIVTLVEKLDMRKAMGKESRLKAEAYGWPIIVKQYEQALNDAIRE